MDKLHYQHDDGGRAAAGFRGQTGDCVTRALAIATGKPYAEIYAALTQGCRAERRGRRGRRKLASAREGVHTRRTWLKRYMTGLGWEWVAAMQIGSGCQFHLRAGELPPGRLIVRVSHHYVAVVDGVIRDTHDPSREGTRCVYGWWRPTPRSGARGIQPNNV